MIADGHGKPKASGGSSRAITVVGIIGSLLGALLLWIYAIGYDNTLFNKKFNGVEVTVQGVERLESLKGFTLAEDQSFSSITVEAKGKRSELNALTSSDFRAVVDVSQISVSGEQTLKITVYAPNGIEVVSQSSASVMVFADEFTQVNLSVTPDLGEYSIGDDIFIGNETVEPKTVSVSGPRSVLETLKGEVYVKCKVPDGKIDSGFHGEGSIELRDNEGNVIDNPYVKIYDSSAKRYINSARYYITVEKQKTLPVHIVLKGDFANTGLIDYEIIGDPSVTVVGPIEKINQMGDELLLPLNISSADVEKLPKTVQISLDSVLGNDIRSDKTDIPVNVCLQEVVWRERVIEIENITVINIPDGFKANISEGISAKFYGGYGAFSEFENKIITASVDYTVLTQEADGSYIGTAVLDMQDCEGVYPLAEYKVRFTLERLAEDTSETENEEKSVDDSLENP